MRAAPPSPARDFELGALLGRYAELDPARAVAVGRASRVPAATLAPAYAAWAARAPEAALEALRQIDDPTAGLACYENNIRQAGPTTRTASVPGRMQVPQGGSAPVAATSSPQNFGFQNTRGSAPPPPSSNASGPQGFGAENVKTPQRFETVGVQSINPRISAIREREPGVFLVTMEDNTQWQFAESVSSNYRVPEVGSSVEIERGALGSYLLRFNNQSAVQVRRIR